MNDIDAILNQTKTWIETIETAKTNVRKVLDCHDNRGFRNALFGHYEALCGRRVIISNVHEDLKIKKNVLLKEKDRCADRSKSLFTLSLY